MQCIYTLDEVKTPVEKDMARMAYDLQVGLSFFLYWIFIKKKITSVEGAINLTIENRNIAIIKYLI